MQMRTHNILLSLLAVYLLISLIFYPFKSAFVFTETRIENPTILYLPTNEEPDFQIIYVHSIHKSEVIESYNMTKDLKINLLSMEYEDLAIGMPGYAEEGQVFQEINGKYKLTYNDEVIESFTILIGNVEVGLLFYYEDSKLDLKQQLKKGKSYQFEIKKLSLYELMKGGKMNEGKS